VYRDGSKMAAQIGPDWVQGLAGSGDTVADAVRDLTRGFSKYGYQLRGHSVGVEVAGAWLKVSGTPGQTPADILQTLAEILEERQYQNSDFAEPDWKWLANEERLVPANHLGRLNHPPPRQGIHRIR
jgi:hypothetical protein